MPILRPRLAGRHRTPQRVAVFGPRTSAPRRWALAGLVLAVVLAAYANSFRGAFVFDDRPAIVENATIQPGTTPADWLRPPAASTVAGRPVLNVSFALNRAVGSGGTAGFHAVNLLIHLAAGALLFGVVRRTLRRVGAPDADLPAATIAGLWLLHPLQTESVTYLVQRAESLAGLLYLAGAYAFIRSLDSARQLWPAATVACAALGMATKETSVTFPVLMLLYDRGFAAASWTELWRRRRGVHLALAATWVVLAALMLGTHGRSGSAGFGTGMSVIGYAGTQIYAVAHYLQLALFPHPLVFDYGDTLHPFNLALAGSAIACATLVAAIGVVAIFRPAAGFAGLAFLMLLAPTSSVVPIASQTIAEHRMYLPLAAAIAALVLVVHRVIGARAAPAWIAAGLALAATTSARNRDYRSELALWTDTAAKRPENPRAHDWLGLAALQAGRIDVALVELHRAVVAAPGNARFHNNLGSALATAGRLSEATREFEAAFAADPQSAEARHNLGKIETNTAVTLLQAGRPAEALPHLRRAVDLEPDNPVAQENLARALAAMRR